MPVVDAAHNHLEFINSSKVNEGNVMNLTVRIAILFFLLSIGILPLAAEDILFEDRFEKSLSEKWEVVGLKKEDYRIRNGGLEMRVQPGKFTQNTPMLKINLPFTSASTVTASVDVTILENFTEPSEMAGVALTHNQQTVFSVRKERIHGHLVFAPGSPKFVGERGEEDDPRKYAVTFYPVLEKSGPLRIIVRPHYAHFQVGPSEDGEYQNFFHSAIHRNTSKRGFALFAAGGSKDKTHWVRFDNFIVTK